MNPDRRTTMEDCCVVDRRFGDSNDGGGGGCIYIGVYDGHGGREMVDFLRHGLSHHVAEEWFDGDDAVPRPLRLERAFLMADLHARHLGVSTSGAAVAVCLIEKENNNDNNNNNGGGGAGAGCYRITTANAGDARIVLGDARGGRAARLTKDHRLDDPLEVARIERAGGFLFKGRVCGVLAVTRSLGDQILKPFVIAHPTVNEAEATAAEGPFLIVACDGLWDVMEDREAVRLVNAFAGDREAVADHLVQEALRRGTADNVTVVVAWLS